MSMPSDMSSDTGPTMGERTPKKPRPRNASLLRDVTTEQVGVAAAAFVAFVGVALIGPRIAELRRPPTLRERARATARDARRRAEAASARTTARLRRVGADTFGR